MKKKERKFVVVKDITIPAGTVLDVAASKIEYVAPHYEVALAIGKDHTATFVLSEGAIKAMGDKIVELGSNIDLSK